MRYFVIAELGINHLGDMPLAREMIDESEKAGADAVKFQYYVWEDIQEEFSEIRTLPNTNTVNPLIQQVKEAQLNLVELGELRDYARSRGLGWVCTPFKRPSRLAELATLKPDAIKIRYRDFDLRLVELALKQDVPLILASCPAPPIENMSIYYNPRARWLYCIPKYPPQPEDFDAARSTGFHGFSDHFPHYTASLLAASLTRGNEYIIEKHVVLDTVLPATASSIKSGRWMRWGRHQGSPPQKPVPDLPVSISFKQLKDMVEHLRLMEKLRPAKPYFPSSPR